MVYNRIFNGYWVARSSIVAQELEVLQEPKLISVTKSKSDQNLLPVQEEKEITLIRKELFNQTILYSPQIYDVFFPTSSKNKSDVVVIRKNISQRSAIAIIDILKDYGVFMSVSENPELDD